MLPEPAEWVKVRGVMDSGAVVHAIGKKHLPTGTQIRQTEMSRQGGYYSAANGSRVYNEGVARLQGQVAGGHTVGLDWQITAADRYWWRSFVDLVAEFMRSRLSSKA